MMCFRKIMKFYNILRLQENYQRKQKLNLKMKLIYMIFIFPVVGYYSGNINNLYKLISSYLTHFFISEWIPKL